MNRLASRAMIAVLLLASAAAAQARTRLDRTERAIARHAEEGHPAAETLLARVVDTESPTENLAGVRVVGDAFAEELRAIGFRTRWIELPPEMKRAGHNSPSRTIRNRLASSE